MAFIFCPILAPSGEAIILATTIIAAGAYNTWSVTTLPTVEPIEEINVIARLEAMVTRVGIFKITSMIGTKINAPAAPTIQDEIPTNNAKITARDTLKSTLFSEFNCCSFLGISIITAAVVASIA